MMQRRAFLASLVATLALPPEARAMEDQVLTLPLPDGTPLNIWLVFPDGYDPAKPVPTLLAFPPGAQDLSMVDAGFYWWAPVAIERGWLLIGPAAPWGKTFGREARPLIGPLLDELLARFPVADGKFHLAGISNGGVSAFAAALDFPDRFRSLTVLAGMPPRETDYAALSALRGMPVNMLVGQYDEGFLAPMTRTRDALIAAGISPHFQVVPRAPHTLYEFQGDAAAPLFDLMVR